MKNTYCLLILNLFLISSYLPAQKVVPLKGNESKYSFKFANLFFEVDAAIGGRISSFKLDNIEILHSNDKNLLQSGSTFWPSPQSVWKWPPSKVLDSKPYKATILNNELILTSDISIDSLRVVKIFSANSQDSSIIIKYILKNEGTKEVKWAPWEITRVKPSGITFFAKGEGTLTGDMISNTSESSGVVWYDQNTTTPSFTKKKFFSDGRGWLAHITLDTILFIKKFRDIAPKNAAPAESEIEVYTEPTKLYTELENQGEYMTINQKDSLVWEVKWFARKLPSTIPVDVGNKGLIDFTYKIINKDGLTGKN